MLRKWYKTVETEKLTMDEQEQIIDIESNEFSYSYKNFEKIVDLINDKSHKFILLKYKEKIIFYCIYVLLVDEIEIYKVWVNKNQRRSGLAHSIMSWILFKKNVNQIVAEVREENTVGRSFYKKLGFEEVRIRKNYYYDNSSCVTLIKKINKK
ncbi:MAG: GNAT family N-acetyltransferase [Mycoplasmoidaceae bacterium]